MNPRNGIVHILFHPVSAKRFAEPLVAASIANGDQAEIWVQPVKGTEAFLASLTVPVKICPSNLGPNPVKIVSAFFSLWKNLRRRRPQVICAHMMRSAFLPLLAATLCDVPARVYYNHGVSYVGYRGVLRLILMAIEGANCRLATHVVTVSESMRPLLRAVASPDLPITVFGPGSACGLDAGDYATAPGPGLKDSARRNGNIAESDLVFLYVGRPQAHKGFSILLKAFDRIFSARPDVRLLICGCTAADVAAAHGGAAPGVRALGYVNEMRPMYQAADVVVLPSRYEGLPYALLEGAAQGCALLSSRIPGPDSLVEEGKNGFFVAPDDIGDLVRALRRMDEDRERLRAMGAAAWQKSLQFRRDLVVGPYLAFMHDIMAAPDSRFAGANDGDKLAA